MRGRPSVTFTALPTGTTADWGGVCPPGPSCTLTIVTPVTVTATLVAPPALRKRGDLDGDGKVDLLLRNTDESLYVWRMDTYPVSGDFLATETAGWTVKLLADFDGDGKSDVLMVHTDG